MLSSDLSFTVQINGVIQRASQMVGWALRSFRGRSTFLLITILKSLVQPHLDYCSQLWSPNSQGQINSIEQVQRNLVSKVQDRRLENCNYWEKLGVLKLLSQERRRERYEIIFIWKITQGLVEGYDMSFTDKSCRTGRKAIPAHVLSSAPASVRRAKSASLSVKGAQLFNLMPASLRNSDHADVPMFKNHLDHIPDQPTSPGLGRAAATNSLLHQVPMYEASI